MNLRLRAARTQRCAGERSKRAVISPAFTPSQNARYSLQPLANLANR